MNDRTLRGKVAVAGIGETVYYKHGKSPDAEFTLALKAILRACEDAGLHPHEIDGFASYSNDRNDPSRIAAALGLPELRFSNMQWGGGGGGGAAAVGNAAAAVATGMSNCVVVFRALAQGQFARFGLGGQTATVSGEQAFTFPYGMISPGQRYAMRAMRFMHEHGIGREPLRAIAMASYHHAQQNPRAVMHGRPLTEEMYDASRWIVEPFRLFDCCLENDGAAALILVAAERARDLKPRPVYLLGAAQGSEHRNAAPVHNAPLYGTSSFTTVAPHLYEMAGVSPRDVDVVQSYENFTGGVLMSLVEHKLFSPDEATTICTFDNLRAPRGDLPLNTSGGNLAECYMHGLELQLEAIRQLRGQSTNQVADVDVSMVCAGPMVTPVSSCIFGSEATI
jgi:acetyl-CoA acetyltransferase